MRYITKRTGREDRWNPPPSLLDLESTLDSLTRVEPLSNYATLGEEIVAGHVRGRVVIDVHA